MHFSKQLVGILPILAFAQDLHSYHPVFNAMCFSAPWPSANIGKPVSPQRPDAELHSLLSQVNSTRIEEIIRKLVSFGTRHTLSSQTDPARGIGAARDWIASEMRSYGGQLKVDVQTYLQQPTAR
jgi:hypothetical protein